MLAVEARRGPAGRCADEAVQRPARSRDDVAWGLDAGERVTRGHNSMVRSVGGPKRQGGARTTRVFAACVVIAADRLGRDRADAVGARGPGYAAPDPWKRKAATA